MRNILIVDDQPYMQYLFTDALMDNTYTIISAEDIEEAREYLDSFKPDLVILDLYINGFNSWTLLQEIKHKYPDLPVLIFTAYDNFMNDPQAIQADAYLIKDYKNIDLISKKICDLLG
jgi:two-component system, response regulator, stage 0 sporulation protein F